MSSPLAPRPSAEGQPQGLLHGITVLEFAAVLAGPSVGSFLAELGAQVIKIENARTGGDVTRTWRLPGESTDAPDSAYFASANWGKESRFVDLSDPTDAARVREWIASADIVLTSFRPGSETKLGLDADSLFRIQPRLILGRITGYGPDRKKAAYDLVLQAETGWMAMNGMPDGPPVKLPVALVDVLAAHQLKQGILLALWQRDRDGRGCVVDVSLYDAAIASLANQASNYLVAGHIPGRMGSLHPNIAPYGECFTCADGDELVLAVGADGQFQALCRVLEHPAWADDKAYATNPARVEHRDALANLLAPIFLQATRNEWLNRLETAGVPAGAIRTLDQVFADPDARRLVRTDAAGKRVSQHIFHLSPAGN